MAVDAGRKNANEAAILYRQGLARALEVTDANVARFEAEVGFARSQYAVALTLLGLRSALGLDPSGKEAGR